jgi:hypothetical protein
MASCFTHIVDYTDIGMIERRSGTRLALETLSRSFRCKGLRQNFDSYFPSQPGVLGTIHFPHSSLTDGRKDFVGTESIARRERHLSDLAQYIR